VIWEGKNKRETEQNAKGKSRAIHLQMERKGEM
jgi:hypothetical protein